MRPLNLISNTLSVTHSSVHRHPPLPLLTLTSFLITSSPDCCRSCRDYDLCEFCESQEGIHQEDHLFVKIRRPHPKLGENKKGKMKPLLKKNVYSKCSGFE